MFGSLLEHNLLMTIINRLFDFPCIFDPRPQICRNTDVATGNSLSPTQRGNENKRKTTTKTCTCKHYLSEAVLLVNLTQRNSTAFKQQWSI